MNNIKYIEDNEVIVSIRKNGVITTKLNEKMLNFAISYNGTLGVYWATIKNNLVIVVKDKRRKAVSKDRAIELIKLFNQK